ncbi:MAG TPA: hypothetical protein VKG38_15560 [Solirubrobacteraceae bacterium]|nr:hypothetical protein [Solirubrobacteraceae bacterium]
MTIGPVPAAGAVPNHAAATRASKPESKEVPGARDNDGDAEDTAKSAQAASPSSTLPGRVNVRA